MRRRKLGLVYRAAAIATAAVAVPLPAGAHNAGYFVLPDGTCHEIGSFRGAPMVGPNGEKTQLDLIPETSNPPFDEYGASFAAFQGKTPIVPGPCP